MIEKVIEKEDEVLRLVVPARAEYLSLVRLVVAAIARDAGFTDESIADLKVALSEASANVVRHAYDESLPETACTIDISCLIKNDHLVVKILDRGCGMTVPPPHSEGLGFGIIGSLMDKVDVETGKSGTCVTMEKSALTTRH